MPIRDPFVIRERTDFLMLAACQPIAVV